MSTQTKEDTVAEEKRSKEELRELQEPNGMAGTSQLVREKGPGFGGEAFARPADETNTDPEAEAFAEDMDEEDESAEEAPAEEESADDDNPGIRRDNQ